MIAEKIVPVVVIALALAGPWAIAETTDPDGVPEVVIIDVLVDWFDEAPFAHRLHAEMADDCESCHHNSDGEAVPCGICHEATGGELAVDPPSLRDAYHLQCVPCHQEVDGPTGCSECHARNRLPDGPALTSNGS